MNSLYFSQVLHATIRHARTGGALLFWSICGDRITMRAYSMKSYRRCLEQLAGQWVA